MFGGRGPHLNTTCIVARLGHVCKQRLPSQSLHHPPPNSIKWNGVKMIKGLPCLQVMFTAIWMLAFRLLQGRLTSHKRLSGCSEDQRIGKNDGLADEPNEAANDKWPRPPRYKCHAKPYHPGRFQICLRIHCKWRQVAYDIVLTYIMSWHYCDYHILLLCW